MAACALMVAASFSCRACSKGILLPANFEAYRHYSRLFKAAVATIAPHIEDRGIDEIYIDLSAHPEPPEPVGKGQKAEKSRSFLRSRDGPDGGVIQQQRSTLFKATAIGDQIPVPGKTSRKAWLGAWALRRPIAVKLRLLLTANSCQGTATEH